MVEIIISAGLAEQSTGNVFHPAGDRFIRRSFLFLLAVAWLPLLLPPAALAETPEEAARSYLAAVRTNRVESVVRAMHPLALKKFQSALIPVLGEAERRGAGPQFMAMFSGAKTVAQLKALSPAEFFASFYRSFGQLNPKVVQTLEQSTFTVLGRVDEGKTAHVLYRAVFTLSDRRRTKLSVISFQQGGGAWKALLTDEYADLADNLRQALPPDKD